MTSFASHIHISPTLWNDIFIIAKLDCTKSLIDYNYWFKQYIEKHEVPLQDKRIEQLFEPYQQENNQCISWSEVWSAVEHAGYWDGWLVCQSQQHQAAMEAKLILHIDGELRHYLIIGQDQTLQFQHSSMKNEQLRYLQQVKDAFDEASIIAITDAKGVITHVNDKFCQISQYSRDELIGRTHRIINSRYHSKSFFATMWATIMSGKVWRGEVKNQAKDGSYYWMNTTIVPYLDTEGKPYQFVSIRTDITARITAESELAKILQQDFRRTIKNLQNCIFKLTRNSSNDVIFILSEGRIAEQLHITTADVEYQRIKDVWHAQYEQLEPYVEQAFNGISNQFELQMDERVFYVYLSPVIEHSAVIEVVGSMSEITKRKKAESLIHYMAHYDSLTNLPNRTSFHQKLSEAIKRAEAEQYQIAVIFMDLDRFKVVNDTMGHIVGDQLLKSVADRLVKSLPNCVYVSRQAGDEFTFFVERSDMQKIESIAKMMLDIMSNPIIIDEVELYITPSIGISMYPQNGNSADRLLKSADSAMYAAKDGGKNNYHFFTEQLHQAITSRLELERDLRKAISNRELELWYQPKVNMNNNDLIGMEALLRWRHPWRGIISADQFMQIAEESNLIVPIGEWVLYEACRQMKSWTQQGRANIQMAVNISLKQFSHSNFPELIAKVLEETMLDASYLELEITESVAQNAHHTVRYLEEIKELGVSISIDDFGTGYSSLSHLSQFPIDRLKIDQSFVHNLNIRNQAIIRTIIDMASHMGISVIAEGVETAEQVEFLKQLKCPEAQGYYYCKPLPILDANEYMMRWQQTITV